MLSYTSNAVVAPAAAVFAGAVPAVAVGFAVVAIAGAIAGAFVVGAAAACGFTLARGFTAGHTGAGVAGGCAAARCAPETATGGVVTVDACAVITERSAGPA